jgi:dCMP deaminase
MRKRLSIVDYASGIASKCAERSEDPFRLVGAVALNNRNRIVATGYNGLLPGAQYDENWTREERQLFMVHAEINMLAYLKQDEASWAFITDCPCAKCLLAMAAHGIRKFYYLRDYLKNGTEPALDVPQIVKFYGLELIKAS